MDIDIVIALLTTRAWVVLLLGSVLILLTALERLDARTVVEEDGRDIAP